MISTLDFYKLQGRVAELEKDKAGLLERLGRLESIVFAKEQAVVEDKPKTKGKAA